MEAVGCDGGDVELEQIMCEYEELFEKKRKEEEEQEEEKERKANEL